jgi:hypothetical protein
MARSGVGFGVAFTWGGWLGRRLLLLLVVFVVLLTSWGSLLVSCIPFPFLRGVVGTLSGRLGEKMGGVEWRDRPVRRFGHRPLGLGGGMVVTPGLESLPFWVLFFARSLCCVRSRWMHT